MDQCSPHAPAPPNVWLAKTGMQWYEWGLFPISLATATEMHGLSSILSTTHDSSYLAQSQHNPFFVGVGCIRYVMGHPET